MPPISDDAARKRNPVIFVFAHDSPAERIAADEAGGDDFANKPNRRRRTALQAGRGNPAPSANAITTCSIRKMPSKLRSLAMMSVSDYGVVVQFLKQAASCNSHRPLAEFLLQAIAAWGPARGGADSWQARKHQPEQQRPTSPRYRARYWKICRVWAHLEMRSAPLSITSGFPSRLKTCPYTSCCAGLRSVTNSRSQPKAAI